ncbi:MAG: hypothetical protein Q9160_006400 [Pyrenula sp. 1 TL-2023]
MCRVYSQASLTIIASRSDGSATGIFGDQAFAPFDVISYKGSPLRVRTNIAKYHESNPVTPPSFNADPICRRAWTLQEALLSKRAVYFTSDELRWECNTWQYCQCGQIAKKYPLKLDSEEWQYEWYRLWRLDDFCPVNSIEDAYFVWNCMLEYYTGRKLSKEQDRLVALSGLARRFADVLEQSFSTKDTYLAGMWKGAFLTQLLWYVVLRSHSIERDLKHDRPSVWRAPSWSWASMEAPIMIGFAPLRQSRLEVIQATTEPLTEDIFGQVKSAFLIVKAPMLHDVRFILDRTKWGSERFPVVRWQSLDLRVEVSFFDNDLEADTDEYLADPKQIFHLLVVAYTKESDEHECLVIVSVSGKPATFERIGKIKLGQHFREPGQNKRAIEDVVREEVTLV